MKKAKKEYLEKLRDPRWQKKRLQILERDHWRCQECGDHTTTLHVHHRYYTRGAEPWDYPDEALQTLCETCHRIESDERPGAEADLLDAARRYLAHHEVRDLARDMETGYSAVDPGDRIILTYALCAALKHSNERDHLLERYWARLRSHDRPIEDEGAET